MSKPSSAASIEIDDGTYPMGIVTIADIGTQTNTKFGTDEEEEKKQLIIVFELPGQTEKGKPAFTLTKWVTNSIGKKSNLAKIYKAAGVPLDADLKDLLGKCVNGNIEHTDGGRAKITAFSAYKGKLKLSTPLNSVFLDDSFDAEDFEAMPEFIQKFILQSPEYDKVSKAKSKRKGKR